MAVNLNDLNLVEEEVPQVDWDAPEGGLYPPSIPVGDHDFIFKLADDPYQSIQREGKNALQVTYAATTTVDGTEKTLNYQRVNTHRSAGMVAARRNASAFELLRALGTRVTEPTAKNIAAALEDASNSAKHFTAGVQWRGYCDHGVKGAKDGIEVATRPSKKKVAAGTQFAWPRNADGQFELFVTCPKCKQGMKVNAEIADFHLPKDGVTTVASSTNGNGTSSVNI
jgi:hypothetical protein